MVKRGPLTSCHLSHTLIWAFTQNALHIHFASYRDTLSGHIDSSLMPFSPKYVPCCSYVGGSVRSKPKNRLSVLRGVWSWHVRAASRCRSINNPSQWTPGASYGHIKEATACRRLSTREKANDWYLRKRRRWCCAADARPHRGFCLRPETSISPHTSLFNSFFIPLPLYPSLFVVFLPHLFISETVKTYWASLCSYTQIQIVFSWIFVRS